MGGKEGGRRVVGRKVNHKGLSILIMSNEIHTYTEHHPDSMQINIIEDKMKNEKGIITYKAKENHNCQSTNSSKENMKTASGSFLHKKLEFIK